MERVGETPGRCLYQVRGWRDIPDWEAEVRVSQIDLKAGVPDTEVHPSHQSKAKRSCLCRGRLQRRRMPSEKSEAGGKGYPGSIKKTVANIASRCRRAMPAAAALTTGRSSAHSKADHPTRRSRYYTPKQRDQGHWTSPERCILATRPLIEGFPDVVRSRTAPAISNCPAPTPTPAPPRSMPARSAAPVSSAPP